MQRAQNTSDLARDTPSNRLLVPEGPSATYLGVDNGVCIVQPDVVIDEDVVNVRIMGVYPQGLPTQGRELISGPPETVSGRRNSQGRERVTL